MRGGSAQVTIMPEYAEKRYYRPGDVDSIRDRYLYSLALPHCCHSLGESTAEAIQLEKMEGDLSRQKLDLETTKNVMRALLTALSALLKVGFVHLDISARNVLVKNNEYYLTDFGCAHPLLLESDGYGYLVGSVQTLDYRSPEIICMNRFHARSDLWSIGVLYLFLRTDFTLDYQYPLTEQLMLNYWSSFLGEEPNYWSSTLESVEFPYKLNSLVSGDERDFIRSLLRWDPAERLWPDQLRMSPFLYQTRIDIPICSAADYLIYLDRMTRGRIELHDTGNNFLDDYFSKSAYQVCIDKDYIWGLHYGQNYSGSIYPYPIHLFLFYSWICEAYKVEDVDSYWERLGECIGTPTKSYLELALSALRD